MTGPSQQQRGLVIRKRRDREIVGAGHPARDQARRGRAGDEGVQDVRARGLLAGLGEHACPVDEGGPVGEELAVGLRHERRVQLRDRGGIAQRGCGLERVEAGIGEVADEPDFFHRDAVDLLDLPHQGGHEIRAGEIDGELVDGHVRAPLQHIDADDVAAHGADA